MFTRIRPFQTLLALLALTGVLSAQTLTVPNGELNPGESIPVSYSNPAMAGQTVTILVDDGALPTPHKSSFQITLDANGNGTAEWTVPLWELAKFNAPGAPEQTRPIANPEVPSQRNACVMRATYAR